MARKLEQLRNIGIIAHIDAGKTTLTERMLYYAGITHRMGEVDKGTTQTDDDAEEQERGITIYAACVTFPWRDVTINLLDTPGHVDFTAEVERCLRVLDGAVVVFSAREGVEAQSETVWRQADKYHVPRLVFINKLDREGADFEGTVKEVRERLVARPLVLQIPVGLGPPHFSNPFRGVIDLVTMKMLTFRLETDGRDVVENEIPAELLDDAAMWRDELLESLYDFSNELMEQALAGEKPSQELIRKVIRQAVVAQQIQPVFCGSALDRIGVQPVLDGVAWYLPSPADRPPVEGTIPGKKDRVEKRKPSVDEPFCGLVFKVLPSKHGDFVWLRVYSGHLKPNSRVLNPGKDKKENVSQLWQIHSTKREEQIEGVGAGDIVGLIGPRDSITGDSLCDPKEPILLESIEFPETVISMAIEPDSSAERKKLAEVLEMLRRQDPTFRARENEETGQTLISGMGELHLEVITHRLLRDFNLKVRVHKPRVSYKESVAHAADVTGECNRQHAGQSLFAKVRIRMEPFEGGMTSVLVTMAPNVSLPEHYLTAVLDTLKEQAAGGGSLGCPLLKVKITVLGAEMHETDSSEIAFRYAAADAFNKALQAAGTVLLEPIMKVEIITPEEHLGDFIADLQQRRGVITHTTSRGKNTVIEAQAPLANLFGYSSAMRGLSQGRASCSMEPSAYGLAPSEVLESFMG
jgi:elongation factor G